VSVANLPFQLKMEIKYILGFFKLSFLILTLYCCHSFGMSTPIAEEVKEIINGITNCHVHVLYDELDLNGPISNPSVTYWRLNKTADKRMNKGRRCRFRKQDVTRVKGIRCVYAIIILARERKLFSKQKKAPRNSANKSVKVYFNQEISFTFDSVQSCFWEDRSFYVPSIMNRRNLSSSSYIMFFTRLSESQWLKLLESDKKLFSYYPRTGLRFINVSSSVLKGNSKAYFQCSFCPDNIPLLTPMQKTEQGDIDLFSGFAKELQYKVWKVGDRINSLSHKWFSNESNVNFLMKGRTFDSPRFLRSLLRDPSNTKNTLDLLLLKMLAVKHNATVILCPFDVALNIFCDQPTFDQFMRRSPIFLSNNNKLQFPGNSEISNLLRTQESSIVAIGVEGQKFLTCYHEEMISFRFYVDPFFANLWVTLALTSFLIAVLLHVFIVKFHKSMVGTFSPYFFIISTITDDNSGMPRELGREPVIRIGLGPWFLMTVVIVNAYVGLVITGLTSPLPLVSVDSFGELTKMHFNPEQIARNLIWSRNMHADFDTTIVMEGEKLFDINRTREFDPDLDFKIYSSLNEAEFEYILAYALQDNIFNQSSNTIFEELLVSYQAFAKFLLNCMLKYVVLEEELYAEMTIVNYSTELRREKLKNATVLGVEDAVILNLNFPTHIFIPKSIKNEKWNHSFASAVEQEIIECGRSAYADSRSVVEMEHKYLSENYFWIKFFLSKEEIAKEMTSWVFPGMHDTAPIVKDLKAFLVTGIYRKLEEYFLKEMYLERKIFTTQSEYYNVKSTQGKAPVSLTDSIQTAFFILGSAVGVCLLAICSEIFWFNKKAIGWVIVIYIANFYSTSKTTYVRLRIRFRR
jgi:hypothetical protein